MRKIIILLVALLLPLPALIMSADEKPPTIKIDLDGDQTEKNVRSLHALPIDSYYFGMMNSIVTTVFTDLGDITLTVTNCSTGSVWYDSFDSALESQTVLPLSGEPGIYEIVYITESGGVYEGTITIQ